jgi:hypothetical protein
MDMTVQEALELDILKDFKVIAGADGLSKKITNVAVWDYETGDSIGKNFRSGDFALSTLVAIKDNINELYDIVERMINVGITCLAIKDVYFHGIPKDVIALANKKAFPIMLFSVTFTEDIIVQINRVLDKNKEYDNLALLVDNILYNDFNEFAIKKVARKININFKEKNMVAFCKRKNEKQLLAKSFMDQNIEESFSKVIPYKEGYIFINTFGLTEEKESKDIILRRLKWWGFDEKEYIIGVSSLYDDLGKLNKSIQESLYAYKHSVTYNRSISFFHEIGIDRLFIPLLDNPWLLKYYHEMIDPLINYDKQNETELLKTAIKYVENNGDINSTAKELFQHGNTVRYRIDRIEKIIYKNNSSQHFYEELATAVRIHTLMDSAL